jgi:hypothetical protein
VRIFKGKTNEPASSNDGEAKAAHRTKESRLDADDGAAGGPRRTIRHRLAESRFNVCPACMDEDAHIAAAQRGESRPSISTYLTVIDLIEQKLAQ